MEIPLFMILELGILGLLVGCSGAILYHVPISGRTRESGWFQPVNSPLILVIMIFCTATPFYVDVSFNPNLNFLNPSLLLLSFILLSLLFLGICAYKVRSGGRITRSHLLFGIALLAIFSSLGFISVIGFNPSWIMIDYMFQFPVRFVGLWALCIFTPLCMVLITWNYQQPRIHINREGRPIRPRITEPKRRDPHYGVVEDLWSQLDGVEEPSPGEVQPSRVRITGRQATPSQFRCIECGEFITDGGGTCPSCGATQQRCTVCNQYIGQEELYSKCPHCEQLAHRSHLLKWIKIRGICPYCKRKLRLEEIK
jgi:hypothetical protein